MSDEAKKLLKNAEKFAWRPGDVVIIRAEDQGDTDDNPAEPVPGVREEG